MAALKVLGVSSMGDLCSHWQSTWDRVVKMLRSLVHEPPRAADVERAVAVEAPGLFDLDTLLFG